MIPILPFTGELPERLKNRTQLNQSGVTKAVKAIVEDVRNRGDAAVYEYTEKFDGVKLKSLRVTDDEIARAVASIEPKLLSAVENAHKNITAYHEKQRTNSFIDFQAHTALGQLILPLDSVAVYAPGGTAAYPSSTLMNLVPARVAGVKRVALFTPPSKDGSVHPLTLAAAHIAGAHEIYKIGGAQAIAAAAYGTQSVKAVDKILGPGNIYVANAKREVIGTVGIDAFAGPSEIMIVADATARADYIAADMLSQAEHDPHAAAILATDDESLANAVIIELEKQLNMLPRADIARESLTRCGTILLTDSVDSAIVASNLIAPEHLELLTVQPFSLIGQVRHAGAIFVGEYSPEPLGDYYAGTNHILPTSGTARFSSPLSVMEFTKRTSVVYYDKSALSAAGDDIIAFAKAEGLTAHANAIAIRMKERCP